MSFTLQSLHLSLLNWTRFSYLYWLQYIHHTLSQISILFLNLLFDFSVCLCYLFTKDFMELQVLNCKKNVLSYLTYEVIVFIMGFYTYVTYLALFSPALLFLSPMLRHIFLDPSLSRNPIVHPVPHPSSLLPPLWSLS